MNSVGKGIRMKSYSVKPHGTPSPNGKRYFTMNMNDYDKNKIYNVHIVANQRKIRYFQHNLRWLEIASLHYSKLPTFKLINLHTRLFASQWIDSLIA